MWEENAGIDGTSGRTPLSYTVHTNQMLREYIPPVHQWMRFTGKCLSRLRVMSCVSPLPPTGHKNSDNRELSYPGLCRVPTVAYMQALSPDYLMPLPRCSRLASIPVSLLPQFNATFAHVYRLVQSERESSVGPHCPHLAHFMYSSGRKYLGGI